MITVAIDTNILAYSAGLRRADDDAAKVEASREVIGRLLTRADLHISNQTLIELYNVLNRNGMSRDQAFDQVEAVRRYATPTQVDSVILERAFGLARFNRFQIFDAVILSSAIAIGATFLLSEDLQHGFSWHGTTIADPFKPDYEAMLASADR